MSYVSTITEHCHSVIAHEDTHIHTRAQTKRETYTSTTTHKKMHTAFLSSCHPPAKSAGEKHHSTLGNKLIHVSEINSLTGS